jgi:hypothetical protein
MEKSSQIESLWPKAAASVCGRNRSRTHATFVRLSFSTLIFRTFTLALCAPELNGPISWQQQLRERNLRGREFLFNSHAFVSFYNV